MARAGLPPRRVVRRTRALPWMRAGRGDEVAPELVAAARGVRGAYVVRLVEDGELLASGYSTQPVLHRVLLRRFQGDGLPPDAVEVRIVLTVTGRSARASRRRLLDEFTEVIGDGDDGEA